MSELGADLLLVMYETAATIRRFELRANEQYRLGNIRGYYHPYLGDGRGTCPRRTTSPRWARPT